MNRHASRQEFGKDEPGLLMSLDFESVPRPEFASRYSYNAGSGLTANKALFPGSNSIAGKTRPESGCGEENTEEEGGCDIRKGDCECGQGQSEPAASKVSLGSAIYDPVNGEGCPDDEHKDDRGEQEDGCDLDDDSTCRICYRGCHHDQPGCYDKSSCANPGGGYMAVVRGSPGIPGETCADELAEKWDSKCGASRKNCCTGARSCQGRDVYASGCCAGCFFGEDKCCVAPTFREDEDEPVTVDKCCNGKRQGDSSCETCNGGGNGGEHKPGPIDPPSPPEPPSDPGPNVPPFIPGLPENPLIPNDPWGGLIGHLQERGLTAVGDEIQDLLGLEELNCRCVTGCIKRCICEVKKQFEDILLGALYAATILAVIAAVATTPVGGFLALAGVVAGTPTAQLLACYAECGYQELRKYASKGDLLPKRNEPAGEGLIM